MEVDESKVELLIKEFGYARGIACAFVKWDGRCAYCGEDLLASRPGYSSAGIDHLVPKSHMQQPNCSDLTDSPANIVLCCSSCNNMKYTMDALEGHDAREVLLDPERRESFIKNVRCNLRDRIRARESEWHRVSCIVRGD